MQENIEALLGVLTCKLTVVLESEEEAKRLQETMPTSAGLEYCWE